MKKIYTIGHCTTSLALFEVTGLEKLIKAKGGFTNIGLDDFSTGTYFVQFVNNGETVTQKFIKE